jgi:YgiT-type zinc finger domain-containing protein
MSTSNLCPLCGGHKRAGTTTFSVDLGDSLVVVRSVPATVCEQCGEEWIGNGAAQELERIVTEAQAKQTQVEIVQLPTA